MRIFKRAIIFILLLFVLSISAVALLVNNLDKVFADSVDLYWVGGDGYWSETAHWSTSSGGAGGHAIPTSSNRVIFDANSDNGSAFSVDITTGGHRYCDDLDFGGIDVTLSLDGSSSYDLCIYGSVNLSTSVDYSNFFSDVRLFSSGSETITSNGATWDMNGRYLEFGVNGGDYQLSDNLTLYDVGLLIISGGTFDANSQNVTITGDTNIQGAFTFFGLTLSNITKNDIIDFNSNVVVTGNYTASGISETNRLHVRSNTAGQQRTITAANVTSSHVDYKDIVGAGTGDWDLSSAGEDSIGYSGCTGITFTYPYDANEDIYWTGLQDGVSGGGSWYNEYDWSTTSGGSGGTPRHYVPTSSNDVYFDANSGFTGGNNVVLLNTTAYCNNMDWTGSDGVATPTIYDTSNGGSHYIYISGNLTLVSSMANLFDSVGTSSVEVAFSSNTNLTTNGSVFRCSTLMLDGDCTLQDDLYTDTTHFYYTSGTWDTNGNDIYLQSAAIFQGGDGTYDGLYMTGAGTYEIWGENTFGTLSRVGTNTFTDAIQFDDDQAITTLVWNGYDISHRLQVGSTVSGTQRQITVNGSGDVEYCDISDIAGVGTYSWDVSAGYNSDLGNNLGITFTTGINVYWVGNSGSWSDVNHWASSSGGSIASGRVPLIQDTAVFDENSFSIPGRTVTIDITNVGRIDTSDVTNTPTISKSGQVDSYMGFDMGSCTWSVTSTYLKGINTISMVGSGSYTFTTTLYVQTNSGYMTPVNFGSDFTVDGAIYLISGTMSLQTYSVTAKDFYSTTTTYARALNLSSGTFTLNDTAAVTKFDVATTNLNIYNTASTIVLTNSGSNAQTFDGQGLTYGDITVEGAGNYILTFQGSNHFETFIVDRSEAAKTLKFTNGTTTYVDDFLCTISGTTVVTLMNTSSNGIWTLSKSSGTVITDYLDIRYSVATGGALFYAGENSTVLDGVIANGTGIITGSPVSLYEGSTNTPTVTQNGTFTVTLGSSTLNGVATSGAIISVTDSPKTLNPGATVITTTGVPPGIINITVQGSGWLTSSPTAPTMLTVEVTSIEETSATLNGAVSNMGGYSNIYAYFWYSVDSSFTTYATAEPKEEMTGTGSYSIDISGLTEDATYYYRAVANNGYTDVAFGNILSFISGIESEGSTTPSFVLTGKGLAVFSGYQEEGDLLFCAEINLTYPPYYPADVPYHYFQLQLLDTDNTTILGASPIMLWGDRPASIYFSATSAGNLTYGDNYTMRIANISSESISANITAVLEERDWYGNDLGELDEWCIGAAIHMQGTDGTTTTDPYIESDPTYGVIITSTAGGYFVRGIPNIASVRPHLFTTGEYSEAMPVFSSSVSYNEGTTMEERVGTSIATDAQTVADVFGLSGQMFLMYSVFAVVLFCIMYTVGQTGGFGALGALCLSLPVMGAAIYFNITDIQLLIILVIAFVFLFVRQFIWKTM